MREVVLISLLTWSCAAREPAPVTPSTPTNAGRDVAPDGPKSSGEVSLLEAEPSALERCEEGDSDACFSFAADLEATTPAEQDRLLHAYGRICDSGVVGGCVNAAALETWSWPGHPSNFARALEMAEAACELGAAPGCANAAWMYRMGKGTDKDVGRAFELNKKACRRGEPKGCNSLGDMHETGEGTEKDLGRARALYEQVCHGPRAEYLGNSEQQHNVGCWSLGLLYAKGLGVDQDIPKARELLDQACRAGVKEACASLREIE